MTNKQDNMFKIIKDRITYKCNNLKFRLILFLMKNSKFISPETQRSINADFLKFIGFVVPTFDDDPYFVKTTIKPPLDHDDK